MITQILELSNKQGYLTKAGFNEQLQTLEMYEKIGSHSKEIVLLKIWKI